MKHQIASSTLAGPITRRFIGAARKATSADADDQIVKAVRDGNTEAFAMLVRRYEDFVFTLVSRMTKSDDQTKDISQEIFLRVYKAIRTYQQRSSFKTWLYRIAYNTALTHINREKKTAITPALDFNRENESYKDRSLKLTMENLIDRLRADLQAVILFHYYDDLKYEEIAEILNCPIGTVKIRLYRAKYELRRLWDRYAV